EGFLTSTQGHVPVFTREVGTDVRVGMDDAPQATARPVGRLERLENGLRIHDVAVPARSAAGRRAFVATGNVRDSLEAQRARRIRDQEAAAFRRIRFARVARDLSQRVVRNHGGAMYRSARSGNSVTITPRRPASASSRAICVAPTAAAPALWPASRPSSMIVPPVPIPITACVTRPSVCSQISGAVPASCARGFASFEYWSM